MWSRVQVTIAQTAATAPVCPVTGKKTSTHPAPRHSWTGRYHLPTAWVRWCTPNPFSRSTALRRVVKTWPACSTPKRPNPKRAILTLANRRTDLCPNTWNPTRLAPRTAIPLWKARPAHWRGNGRNRAVTVTANPPRHRLRAGRGRLRTWVCPRVTEYLATPSLSATSATCDCTRMTPLALHATSPVAAWTSTWTWTCWRRAVHPCNMGSVPDTVPQWGVAAKWNGTEARLSRPPAAPHQGRRVTETLSIRSTP